MPVNEVLYKVNLVKQPCCFFYDRITGTIDKGVHVGIAFFIFNKAFDLMT